MKRLLSCLIALGALVALTGCMRAPVVPPVGYVYNNWQAPLDCNYQATPIKGKTGVSESTCILGLVAWGDASAKAAAENGSIAKIEHADYEFFNVLGVYQRYRTMVTGE